MSSGRPPGVRRCKVGCRPGDRRACEARPGVPLERVVVGDHLVAVGDGHQVDRAAEVAPRRPHVVGIAEAVAARRALAARQPVGVLVAAHGDHLGVALRVEVIGRDPVVPRACDQRDPVPASLADGVVEGVVVLESARVVVGVGVVLEAHVGDVDAPVMCDDPVHAADRVRDIRVAVVVEDLHVVEPRPGGGADHAEAVVLRGSDTGDLGAVADAVGEVGCGVVAAVDASDDVEVGARADPAVEDGDRRVDPRPVAVDRGQVAVLQADALE